MKLSEFLTEIKNLITKLFNYQKTGSLVILHFYDDDENIEFEKYYSPSFYNNGTANVIIEGITIPPGQTLYWQQMPFALSETVIRFKFDTTGAGPVKDLVVSYGVLHANNP